MFKKSLIALFVLALVLTACATQRATPTLDLYGGALPQTKDMPSEGGRGPSQAEGVQPNTLVSAPQPDIQRLVIMNADLGIVVVDPPAVLDSITKMAQDMQGFVVSSRLYKVSIDSGIQVPEATITVRVPAEKLTNAMDQIKALVKDPKTDITSENVSGQDVTKEYVDLQSQLTNLQQAETQLQKIMDSATKTEDVMMVYNQLVQVRQQIETIKGQMKYYEESARLSAINVTIQAQESVAPLTIGGWQPVGVARNAGQALLNTLKFIANAMIWIVLFILPVVVVIGLIIWLFVIILLAIFRRAKKNKPAPPTAIVK
jgi:type III secretory pathway lipoprotein EscJ